MKEYVRSKAANIAIMRRRGSIVCVRVCVLERLVIDAS